MRLLDIGVATSQGGMPPLNFLEHIVILRFERQYPKQNRCYSSKIKHFRPPQIFELATPLLLDHGSGTYASRARCGSFDDGFWLAQCFLNTIVTNENFFCNFPSSRLQSHQQHQKSH